MPVPVADLRFFRLVQSFSRELSQTPPADQHALMLAYLHLAYEFGLEARWRHERHEDGADDPGRFVRDDEGKESGLVL